MLKRTTLMMALVGVWSSLASPAPVSAQDLPPRASLDMREADQTWVNDPHVHDFYRLTVEAFAAGPRQVDRPAYEKRSREIFRALAVARHMSPEGFVEHDAAIPGQMIEIVTRDPQTLATYEAFVVALFGPQGSPMG